MPRPIRIEYPNALYHVINRGRGRCNIFHDDIYYQSFLKVIEESHVRFGLVVHAYCLMSNHYHLLIETPNANLGRIMRHINGIYTQRYNRLKKTDGPLFRGRYKAILVEESKYLLELNRYIHRNPIETKVKMVKNIQDYKWSSYPYYLNAAKNPPSWLSIDKTLKIFGGGEDPLKNYELFVNSKNEENLLEKIYQNYNLPTILGGVSFKEKILFQKLSEDASKREKVINQINKNKQLTIEQIVNLVSEIFLVEKNLILNRSNGRQTQNLPRAFAMFICQKYQDLTLSQIANIFNLSHKGSASKAICRIEKIINEGGLDQELKLINNHLWLMEET